MRSQRWQAREAEWRAFGLASHEGREDIAGAVGGQEMSASVFSAVLCELIYGWLSAPADTIWDPFAGGSVRGVVAAFMGRHYEGADIRAGQVAANEHQADALLGRGERRALTRWLCADSAQASPPACDLIFSCPPYLWLEAYGGGAADLSSMSEAGFIAAHAEIIRRAANALRPDRFAAWVVGDVRRAGGGLIDMRRITEDAFSAAGCVPYNRAVLVAPIGSKAVTSKAGWERSRKIAACHQDVLVFSKGDAAAATARLKAKP